MTLKRLDNYLTLPCCGVSEVTRHLLCRGQGAGDLIVRPGGMGDLVAAMMALEWLGVSIRDVHWLIESRSKPWAEYTGVKFSCYDIAPLRNAVSLLGKFARVINTEQLYGMSQAYALLCADQNNDVWNFSTNRGKSARADHVVNYDWDQSHEVIEFARLFAQAMGKPFPSAPLLRPRLRAITQPPVIVIAGQQSESRRLTASQWAPYCERWLGGRECFLVSSEQDRALATELASLIGERARLFSGNFGQICELVAASEEVFTMDGGMVHVASYFGVKTVALFTSGREMKWRPLASGSEVWRCSQLPCQPCTKFGQTPPCPNDFACKKIPLP